MKLNRRDFTLATLTAFAGSAELPERPSSGSRRRDMVDAVVQMHRGVLG